ncbi:MAG TPA: hypothetical protein VK483_00325 [Chitinophagaceae bacterium]|nr:hypothetical protein [Chitinophagaceae bacterium]
MKNLRIPVLCACITLCSLFSAAQDQKFIANEPNHNKPRLFDNLPEVIPVSIENLNSLVNTRTGTIISTTLSSDARTAPFEGNVVSSVSKYENKVQTVVIKSTNYNGATLYISKVITDDGTTKYNGRLMSFQHGDLYVLQQKDAGFVLVKKNYYDVINE